MMRITRFLRKLLTFIDAPFMVFFIRQKVQFVRFYGPLDLALVLVLSLSMGRMNPCNLRINQLFYGPITKNKANSRLLYKNSL